jgi:hypothetical protein
LCSLWPARPAGNDEPNTDAVVDVLRDARKARRPRRHEWSLVVTEYGWASGGPPAQGKTYSEAEQAQLIRNSLLKMAELRKKLKIASAIYYTWHDLPRAVGQKDFWGLHTGLLRLTTLPSPPSTRSSKHRTTHGESVSLGQQCTGYGSLAGPRRHGLPDSESARRRPDPLLEAGRQDHPNNKRERDTREARAKPLELPGPLDQRHALDVVEM